MKNKPILIIAGGTIGLSKVETLMLTAKLKTEDIIIVSSLEEAKEHGVETFFPPKEEKIFEKEPFIIKALPKYQEPFLDYNNHGPIGAVIKKGKKKW